MYKAVELVWDSKAIIWGHSNSFEVILIFRVVFLINDGILRLFDYLKDESSLENYFKVGWFTINQFRTSSFFLVSCDYLHILVITWKVSVAYLGIKTVPNKNVWYLVIFCQDFYEQVSVFWDSYWVLAQFFEGTMGISMVSSDISSFLKGFSAELEDYDTFFNQSSRWFFFFFFFEIHPRVFELERLDHTSIQYIG